MCPRLNVKSNLMGEVRLGLSRILQGVHCLIMCGSVLCYSFYFEKMIVLILYFVRLLLVFDGTVMSNGCLMSCIV